MASFGVSEISTPSLPQTLSYTPALEQGTAKAIESLKQDFLSELGLRVEQIYITPHKIADQSFKVSVHSYEYKFQIEAVVTGVTEANFAEKMAQAKDNLIKQVAYLRRVEQTSETAAFSIDPSNNFSDFVAQLTVGGPAYFGVSLQLPAISKGYSDLLRGPSSFGRIRPHIEGSLAGNGANHNQPTLLMHVDANVWELKADRLDTLMIQIGTLSGGLKVSEDQPLAGRLDLEGLKITKIFTTAGQGATFRPLLSLGAGLGVRIFDEQKLTARFVTNLSGEAGVMIKDQFYVGLNTKLGTDFSHASYVNFGAQAGWQISEGVGINVGATYNATEALVPKPYREKMTTLPDGWSGQASVIFKL